MFEEVKYIPRKRHIETFKAVIDTSEGKNFHYLIQISQILFESNSQNIISTIDHLIDYINKHDTDDSLPFLIDILFIFVIVRPQQRTTFLLLLSSIYLSFPLYQSVFNKIISKHSVYKHHEYIQQLLNYQGLLTSEMKEELEKKKLAITTFSETMEKKPESFEEIVGLFPYNTIEFFIKEDDLSNLQQYLQKNKGIISQTRNNDSFHRQIIDADFSFKYTVQNFTLTDLAAFYGSVNCFKYLFLNNCPLGNEISQLAIAGGNHEICHIIEQKGITFDSCFMTCVKLHRYQLSDWLLMNYKCQQIPLTYCLECKNYTAFLFFLLNGADVNEESFTHLFSTFTPLSAACQYDSINSEIIQLLIERHANPNLGDFPPLCMACMNEHNTIKITKLLINSGASVSKGTEERNPIIAACENENSNYEVIKLLIDNGADVNSLIKGETPLTVSCSNYNSDVRIIQLLIENGADMKLGDQTPLYRACSNGKTNLEIIKYLIKNGADVNEDKHALPSPLCLACSNENANFEMVKLFVESGADVNKISNGITPLQAACSIRNSDIQIVRYLVEHGANIQTNNPLYHACANDYNNYEIIKFLIDQGADVNNEHVKQSPLCAACEAENINNDVIELLLQKGADVNSTTIEYIDMKVYAATPLYFACSNRNVTIQIVKTLIDKGADVNKGDWLPLSAICSNKPDNIEIIKLLLEHGADPNQNNLFNKLCSVKNIKLEVFQLLAAHGAKINKEECLDAAKRSDNYPLITFLEEM